MSIARAVGRSIDLLISDIRLGSGSSGIELARELSFTSPRIRIVLMSGTDLHGNEIPNGWHFLPKPFGVSELVDVINQIQSRTSLPRYLHNRTRTVEESVADI